jgi:hypothetical protein
MTRDQVGDILRQRGYLGGSAAPGVQEPGKPEATTPLAPTPPDPSMEGSGILGPGDLKSTARGMAKGAAEFGVGATRLAGKGLGLISPGAQSKLGELAEQVPGVPRLEQFADRPYTDLAEAAGDLGGSILSGGAIERGITTGLVRGVDALTPLARMTRTPAGQLTFVPTTAGKITKYAAPAAGAVGAGAAGGIAGDPEDPVTGAEVGAATGFVPGAVGRGMRSRAGQYLGGSLARSAAGAAMHGAAPGAGLFAHGLRHTVVSYHSPMGQWLQKFGKGLFDQGGRLIGWINPLTGGFVASNALGGGPTDDSAPDPYQQPSPPVASTEEGQ